MQETSTNLEKIKTSEGEVSLDTVANAVNPFVLNARSAPNTTMNPELPIRSNVLRDFSVNYPIVRACIDYIKNKVTQLEWAVVPIDGESPTSQQEAQIEEIMQFFKEPSGLKSTFTRLEELIIEDYLVIGAVTIEKARTVGGDITALIPFDSATVKVRLLEDGRIPEPPEVAFEQWIRGKKVSSMTADEVIYAIRNHRTNSPFGLSPLESLIIQVKAALASDIYNLNWFTNSNLAEGFVELPDLPLDKIKEYQAYWDALIAGDPRKQRRIKFVPEGMKYTPTKKAEDMAFEKFSEWLLKQTCAVFGVPPQDIGFTTDINRSTADVQAEKGQERAKRPMVNFLQELFTSIIQKEMGFTDFKFVYLNIDPVDKLNEAKIDTLRIKSGINSVDEIRIRDGLDPVGLEHYIMTGKGPLLIDQINSGAVLENTSGNSGDTQAGGVSESNVNVKDDDKDLELMEIKQWKKCAVKDMKLDRPFREFKSTYIEDEVREDIEHQLKHAVDREDLSKIFDVYLNGQYKSVVKLRKLANVLKEH